MRQVTPVFQVRVGHLLQMCSTSARIESGIMTMQLKNHSYGQCCQVNTDGKPCRPRSSAFHVCSASWQIASAVALQVFQLWALVASTPGCCVSAGSLESCSAYDGHAAEE